MSENRPSPNIPIDSKTTFEIFKTQKDSNHKMSEKRFQYYAHQRCWLQGLTAAHKETGRNVISVSKNEHGFYLGMSKA